MSEQVKQYLDSLSDGQVLEYLKVAHDDIHAIPDNQLNGEWHEACFAGLCMLAQEASKRGLKVAK